MAAEDEIPPWMTCPLKATMEEKERHTKRRKEMEDKLIPKLEDLVKQNGVDLSDLGNDEAQRIILCRFLRARRFQVKDAFQMLEEHIAWRTKHNVASLHSPGNDNPAFSQLLNYWPGGIHGVDRDDIGVYYERIGLVDPTCLFKQFDREDLIRFHIYKQEESLEDIIGKAVERGEEYKGRVAIIDLQGVGWKHMHREGMCILKEIIRLDESNYPEVLKRLYIIRAPSAFTAIWKLVKPWLHERTLAKIEICGYDFLELLQLEIDPDQIPEFYGGKLSCSTGCFDSKRGVLGEEWDGSCKSLYVGRADSAELSVNGVKDQVFVYEFETECYDISFGFFFVDEKQQKNVVRKTGKVNSHQVKVEGSFTFPSAGRSSLFFDNTSSWTRGKTVSYRGRIVVKEVEGEEGKERQELEGEKKDKNY